MSKHPRKRIELTESQIARLDSAVTAIEEILIAYSAANGEDETIELSMKAKREKDMSGEYPWPKRTKLWWSAGDYFNGEGAGRTLSEALKGHFDCNDAQKKRESAKRCRIQADIYEREANELEAAEQKEKRRAE